MGAICSKGDSEVASTSDHQQNTSSRAINPLEASASNNNSPMSASLKNKAKRQAAVSIVGADDMEDDLNNSKKFGNSGLSNVTEEDAIHNSATNILPNSPGTTAMPSNHSQASNNSNPMSRTSSPPASGHRSGKDSVLSNSSLAKEMSIGEVPASDLPVGSVIRRDNSISMPTRRRGSSVSLVLTPDQHLTSTHCRSPPAPALSREGSMRREGEHHHHNKNTEEAEIQQRMDDFDLNDVTTNPIAHAVIESQLHQQLQDEANERGEVLESNARRLSSPIENLEQIPVAGEMSISVSKDGSPNLSRKGSHHNSTHSSPGLSGVNREKSLAGDEPDAQKMDSSGNVLLLPTHRKKRGSSVCLMMSPEDHLKSPRIDSPSTMKKNFNEAAGSMPPLELGKRLMERDTSDQDDENKE